MRVAQCRPVGYYFMLKALIQSMADAGRPGQLASGSGRSLRYAIVSDLAPMTEDTEIEVVLKRSGLTFIVPSDKSILQVLIEGAVDPMYD